MFHVINSITFICVMAYNHHTYECNETHPFHVHNSLMIIDKYIKLRTYHNQEIDHFCHPKEFPHVLHALATTDCIFVPIVFPGCHLMESCSLLCLASFT